MVSVVNWWRTLFEESIFGKQKVLVLAEKLVAVGEQFFSIEPAMQGAKQFCLRHMAKYKKHKCLLALTWKLPFPTSLHWPLEAF